MYTQIKGGSRFFSLVLRHFENVEHVVHSGPPFGYFSCVAVVSCSVFQLVGFHSGTRERERERVID